MVNSEITKTLTCDRTGMAVQVIPNRVSIARKDFVYFLDGSE